MADERRLLIEAWQARDALYRKLFGDFTAASPSRYEPPSLTAPEAVVPGDSGGSADPGHEDQRLTVLSYAPDPLRPYWIYLTSGLSNPWLQQEPEEVSGFGMELMIKTPVESAWPAQVLRTMAFYVFNYAATISPGVRIALNGPVSVNAPSELQNLFIWYADEAPEAWYQLPSGGFGIFLAIGIAEDECRYAESVEDYGTWCIQELLRQTGVGQLTDPSRKSVMNKPESLPIIRSLRQYAENFPGKQIIENP